MSENNLFRKPTAKPESKNKYEILGFKQNPFPIDPAVKPYSKDERENGSIYLTDLRRNEIQQFKDIVIKQPNKIYLLMDYAAFRGRGIGKTAFLNYEKKQINADLGYQISDGEQVLFSIYVSPGGEKKERKFWQIARLIYQAMEHEDLLLMAFCRLRSQSNLFTEDILAEVSYETLGTTIGSDKWVGDKNISVVALNNELTKQLQSIGIDANLRTSSFNGNTFDSFKSSLCNDSSDYYWRKEGVEFVFNTMVRLLNLAGFSNCIILFDEAEKIITAQNLSERRELCDNLRYYFVDGINENTSESLYKILLTIHPNSQELLLPHWNAAGLERFSQLGGDEAKHNTLFFHPIPNIDLAISLAKEYLKKARNVQISEDDTSPFVKEAFESALEKSEGIPGKFLKLLYTAIEKAIEDGWTKIDKGAIDNVWKTVVSFDATKKDGTAPLSDTKTQLDS